VTLLRTNTAAAGQTLGVRAQAGSRQLARCEDVDCAAFRDGFLRTVPSDGDLHNFVRQHAQSRTQPDGLVYREQPNHDQRGTVTLVFEPGQQCLLSRAGRHGWMHTRPGLLTVGTPEPQIARTARFKRKSGWRLGELGVSDARQLGTIEEPVAQREWSERMTEGTDALSEHRQRG
jgi:hypothetical protein